MTDSIWTIVVHGGARTIAADAFEANRRGCAAAAAAGADVLRDGGSAVAAAQAAIRVLEDDPTFNAGRGSVQNADGDVEMDAAIMDGASLAIGAVAAVRRLRNPIDAAVAMLPEAPVLLVGPGAERFAIDRGLALLSAEASVAPATNAGHDTVGCVARDRHGHFAAATSTGGLSGTMAGRVGDSPLPGCGFYADDAIGAVSLSGEGEAITRVLAATQILRGLESGSAANGASALAPAMRRVGGEAGAIIVDKRGCIGIAHTSDHFAIACASHKSAGVTAGIHRDELKDVFEHD